MSIKKRFLKSKPVCKVTFTVADVEAEKVSVVGDFNNWKPKANPLKKLKNGSFKGSVDLEQGNKYQFRYLIDGKTYLNDDQADGYAYNDFAGTENAVLEV
ncbi:MAG: glycoside hydrolase [Flavobacteriales bacterium]|nr:MAG: glycoside hydrolase [Flavobacteriales bacterium]